MRANATHVSESWAHPSRKITPEAVKGVGDLIYSPCCFSWAYLQQSQSPKLKGVKIAHFYSAVYCLLVS